MPRRKKSVAQRLFCSVYRHCHAALVANPFWKWNTFWIVGACAGSHVMLSLPEPWLQAHPNAAWTAQQVIYGLALLYKFCTNTPPDLPVKPPQA